MKTTAFLYSQIVTVVAVMLLIALTYVSFQGCGKNDEIAALKLGSQKMSKSLNSKGLVVSSQAMLIASQKEQIEGYADSIFSMSKKADRSIKDYHALVVVNQKLVKRISAPIRWPDTNRREASLPGTIDTVYALHDSPSFFYEDDWTRIRGRVERETVEIDSLVVLNVIGFRVVEKKSGLFKRGTVVDVINMNPDIINTGITSVYVKHKPSAWNRWIKPTLAAVVTGVAVSVISK